MTLQQIKDSLPKYRYLTPGVDVWRDGDEILDIIILGPQDCLIPFKKIINGAGTKVSDGSIGRRPIPDEVLDNQAFWVLYNKLAEIAANRDGLQFRVFVNPQGVTCLIHVSRGTGFNGLRQFISPYSIKKAIPLLGGEQNIIRHLSAGDLYSKWIGEQLI